MVNSNPDIAQRSFRLLTLRWILALVLITLLALAAQGVVQRALGRSAQDAFVLNMAGRQRMLSQKATKLALTLTYRPAGDPQRPEWEGDLDETMRIRDPWDRRLRGIEPSDPPLPLTSPHVAAMIWQSKR